VGKSARESINNNEGRVREIQSPERLREKQGKSAVASIEGGGDSEMAGCFEPVEGIIEKTRGREENFAKEYQGEWENTNVSPAMWDYKGE